MGLEADQGFVPSGVDDAFRDAGHMPIGDNVGHMFGRGNTRDFFQSALDPGNVFGFARESKKSRRARRAIKENDAKLAAITRDQFDHFLDFYRPIEEQVLKEAMRTDFTAEGDQASATARAGVRSATGQLNRNLRRSGLSMSGDEAEAVRRRRSLNLTKASGRAENTTRRGLADSRTNLLAQVIGIGRGVSSTATGGLQNVADLGAARQESADRLSAQQQASNTQAGASIAGAIIAAF